MQTRMRRLTGANILLCSGPFLAGMAGFGWGMVPLFVSVFVVWLMTLWPEHWPASPAEWVSARGFGVALALGLSQLMLVTLLTGLGRGVMGLAGKMPDLHPLLPLFLSVAALVILRHYREAHAALMAEAAAKTFGKISPLLALPEDTDETLLRGQLDLLLAGPFLTHRLDALVQAISASGRQHEALRRAVVIWATEPEVVAPGRVPNAPAAAFALSNRNPDLLRLFLPRALALAAAFPDRATGFPPVAALCLAAKADLGTGPNDDLPADLRADLRDGLLALARAVETALAGVGPAVDADARDPAPHGSSRTSLQPG